MSKVIHLVTTLNCSACKLQETILNNVLKEHEDIELKVYDYTETPEWIINNVIFRDFPVTIFIKDNIIKYYFSGTKSFRSITKLIKDINF